VAVPAVLRTTRAALLGAVSPEEPGHYPVCPLYAVTGLYCPGCGGLRAVHALVHGDLGTAAHRNLLVVLFAPVAVWAWGAWLRRRLGRRVPARVPPVWLPAALFGVLVLFAVLRNLPGFGLLAP